MCAVSRNSRQRPSGPEAGEARRIRRAGSGVGGRAGQDAETGAPQAESVGGCIVTRTTFERLLTAQAIIRASRDAWAERKGTDDPLIRKLTTAMINAFDKQLDLIDEELNLVIADITAGTGKWG
jgi:hypothetical protein